MANSDSTPDQPSTRQEGGQRLHQSSQLASQPTLPSGDLPRISVITVVYNSATLLEATICSVLSQTYPNLEHIVIDGGSTDGTLDLLHRYDQQIEYWLSEPDRGISHAFNKGLALAQGEWINFLNAGDRFMQPDTVDQVSQHLQQAPIVIGFAQFGQQTIPKRVVQNGDRLNIKAMISHQAAFVQRQVFDQVGNFNEAYRLRMDYEFWLRALPHYDFYRLDQLLVDYDPHGISGQPAQIRRFYGEEKRANFQHHVPLAGIINAWVALKCSIKLLRQRLQSRLQQRSPK